MHLQSHGDTGYVCKKKKEVLCLAPTMVLCSAVLLYYVRSMYASTSLCTAPHGP